MHTWFDAQLDQKILDGIYCAWMQFELDFFVCQNQGGILKVLPFYQ